MLQDACATDSARITKRAGELADVASILAEEAAQLALIHSGDGHDSRVAARAAAQAKEASQLLRDLSRRGATAEETIQAATWALTSAAVALTQAKLRTPLDHHAAASPDHGGSRELRLRDE